MAIRSKVLTRKVRKRIETKVSEARRRGIANEALAWVERMVRAYEFAAVDHGVALILNGSARSTAEAVLAISLEAKDALERRNRELEERVRALETELAHGKNGRPGTVVPLVRKARFRRGSKTPRQIFG